MIIIYNFHVLRHLLLIYICKLHWKAPTEAVPPLSLRRRLQVHESDKWITAEIPQEGSWNAQLHCTLFGIYCKPGTTENKFKIC